MGCLAGALTGSIASGFMLAVMMSNAGGAWDNAKKYMEIALKAKKTEQHKATVVGDTVGDPFKDTSGPALNILIKLMSMVSLVIAPILTREDWGSFAFGFIPLGVMIIVSIVTYKLFWAGFEEKATAKHAAIDAIKAENVKNKETNNENTTDNSAAIEMAEVKTAEAKTEEKE